MKKIRKKEYSIEENVNVVETNPPHLEPDVPIGEKPREVELISRKKRGIRIYLPTFDEFLRSFGRSLGIAGPLTLSLWKENFSRRTGENEIGVCLKNSCGCCFPFCGNCLDGKDSRRLEKLPVGQTTERQLSGAVGIFDYRDYVYGNDGLTFYDHFSKMESALPRDVIGGNKKNIRQKEIIETRKELIENVLKQKKGGCQEEEKSERELRRIKHCLKPIAHKYPFFILTASVVQFVFLLISLIGAGGFAPVGFEPRVTLVSNLITFRGIEDVDVWTRPNIWLGPPLDYLISIGAIYAPCMRTDKTVRAILASQQHRYAQGHGCCVNRKHDVAGTASQIECDEITLGGGRWFPIPCSRISVNVSTILKPCCYGLLGSCKMTTNAGCRAHGGQYFSHGQEHCSQVFCFPGFCGDSALSQDENWPFMPETPNQGWRFLTSILFHAGILHYLLVLIVQWSIGRPIEAAIGFPRMAFIYFCGAVGGNLVGAYFNPYLPQVGCAGAVFGLVSISFFEILQAGERLRSLSIELLSILLVALILLFSGFLPLVSNFAHLGGGLLFALPAALLVTPHLCFRRFTRKCRLLLIVLSIILLLLFTILFLVLFYAVQNGGFCRGCHAFSCFPFTKNVCNVLVELLATISHD